MQKPIPKLGFYFTPENITMAQKNSQNHPWVKQRLETLHKHCDHFLSEYRDEDIYRCVLSMQGQAFAYGISGCPYCKGAFPSSPEIGGGFLSRFPEKNLTCPSCASILPNQDSPDDGAGFLREGKAYYPIGVWNFHTAGWLLGGVRDHEGMVTKLTYAYMLTGEKKYAQKALVILDAFAAIFPETIGPRDFTPFQSKAEMGRLHLLTSVVHRVKVFLAHNYDWLYHLEEMDTPSPALALLGRPGTFRENIERMLNDYMLTELGGPAYDLKGGNLTELHNHEADGVRAMLAVGLVTEQPDYQKWGIKATEVFLSNAVGRDGMYFEGSYGYSMFTITVFLDMALLAIRAASPEQLRAFHPFASERFFRFAVQNPAEMLCQGHLPCYGDWGQDRRRNRKLDPKTAADIYRAALHFYHYSPDPAIQKEAFDMLQRTCTSARPELGDKGMDLFLFHPCLTPRRFTWPAGTTLAGQAGVGILRDANDTTILMRTGANHTHAHDDILAYNYYVYGKEISADIGYSTYGSNGHYGWATKSIAHNTVVVNEDQEMKKGQLYKPFPGGEVSLLYESPHVAAYEGKAPGLYGLDAYQRMAALAPLPDGSSYLVDLFYIQGAEICDYTWRSFHEKAELRLDGVKECKTNDAWTLAGINAREKPYFDTPGNSFGERLTIGETFSPLLEEEKAQYWTPAPNNGYGFIYGIRQYEPLLPCVKACWESEEGFTLTWHGLTDPDDHIIIGTYPTLSGKEHHPVLIVRSRRPAKQYVALIHTRKTKSALRIQTIHRLATRGSAVMAFATELTNGWLDFWAYSPLTQTMCIHTRFGEWRIRGRCGFIRTDRTGKILASACIEADVMTFQGLKIEGNARPWVQVQELNYKKRTIRLHPHSPPKNAKYIRIAPSPEAPAALYSVKEILQREDGILVITRDSFSLSQGAVATCQKDVIRSLYPLPLAASFRGKLLLGKNGGRAVIEDIPDVKTIRAHILAPFMVGEAFDIVDVAEHYWAQWL
ncbi:Heparinase II/III-like protein [Aneurinibacillus thermoaerophilus]|uniref:Heparinase II/III-like protein n=1 Tax=Aneurinibacillus thermoaerophilus TaxID=143495 RepID=A0A1G8CB39_ANETH|nr:MULTISPECIES: heparinase II/III family protein [Aneurinibacillus]AMA71563.1 hypothetical protein ACH33_01075 [Aneurinibacillus sp. XH2]SDH42559.1 Heparinase II/III-like protein [Aneurinibacillus thermoaerophilus]